jgi:uncharacterized protein (DUF3820 family)
MSRSTQELDDESPMPFGKHKGVPMSAVPASYLHWMWFAGKKDDPTCSVHKYIKSRKHALAVENPDLIW